jgi:hypothetical protein
VSTDFEWCEPAIRDRWQMLACIAYQGFLDVGRGAIVLSRTDESGADYIVAAGVTGDPRIIEHLANYDPKLEVVVITQEPGSVAQYGARVNFRAIGGAKPKNAYERGRARPVPRVRN